MRPARQKITTPQFRKACERHREMVLDPYRTPLIAQAIAKATHSGDRVVDVGCGLGVLSFLALRAGASTVDAIDCDREALAAARHFSKELSLHSAVNFHEGLSFGYTPKNRADLLVCEIIGSLGFEENILPTLLDARKRFLKPGGKIIPMTIELWGALVDERARYAGWSDVAGLDLRSATAPLPDWKAMVVAPDWLLSRPARLAHIDTGVFTCDEINVSHEWHVLRPATLGGLCLWPKITWWHDIETDASPLAPPTHWKQGVLPLPQQELKADAPLRTHLIIRPDPKTPETQTEILWK